jgi:hypothetical protein
MGFEAGLHLPQDVWPLASKIHALGWILRQKIKLSIMLVWIRGCVFHNQFPVPAAQADGMAGWHPRLRENEVPAG